MTTRLACLDCTERENIPAANEGQRIMMINGDVYWADADGGNAVFACTDLACIATDGTITAGALGNDGQILAINAQGGYYWTGTTDPDVEACDEVLIVTDSNCLETLRCVEGQILSYVNNCVSCADLPPVNIIPMASLSDTTICEDDTITVINDSTITDCLGTPTYEHLYSSDGVTFTSYATTEDATFDPPSTGSFTIRFSVTCDDVTETIDYTVDVASVSAGFSASPATVGAGSPITITDSATLINCTGTPSYVYEVSADGGATFVQFDNQADTVYTPPTAGSYIIRQTVGCPDHGCSDQAQVTVTAIDLQAAFTVDLAAVCIGETVTITDASNTTDCTGTIAYQYQRSLDGGVTWATISSSQDTTYTPTTSGEHQLRLIVTCNGVSSTSAVTTVEASSVSAGISPSATSLPAGSTLGLNDASTIEGCSGTVSYVWEVSTNGGTDFTQISTDEDTSYIPLGEGSLLVRHSAICDANGCTDVTTTTITVTPTEIVAEISIDDTTICVGGGVSITNISTTDDCIGTPTYAHQISVDGGTTWTTFETTEDATFAPVNNTGELQFRLQLTCNGLTVTSDVVNVEVAEVIASFNVSTTTITTAQTIDVTDTSTLTNCTGSASYLHEYSNNNGFTWVAYAATADAEFVPPAAGTYLLRLTVTCDDHGCSDSFQTTVGVTDTVFITPQIIINNTPRCLGGSVTIQDNSTVTGCSGAPVVTPQFSTDGGATYTDLSDIFLGGSITHTPPSTGTYRYRVRVICDGITEFSGGVDVSVSSINATLNADMSTITLGGSVSLTGTETTFDCTIDTDLIEVSTDGGANFTAISTSNTVTHTPAITGTHIYRYTATCDTGCDAVATVSVTVNEAIVINPAITVDDATVCTGATVSVTDGTTITGCTGTPTYSHQFSTDGGANWNQYATTEDAQIIPGNAGTLLLRVVVTCDGESQTSAGITVEVAEVIASYNLSATTIGTADTIDVTDTSTITNCTGATTYLHEYSDDGGTTYVQYATTQNATFTPPSDGTFLLRMTVDCSTHGCSSTIEQTVTVTPGVVINPAITINDTLLCINDETTVFNASTVQNCTGTPTYSHQVSTDGGANYTEYSTNEDATHNPGTAGTYLYRLQVTCDGVTQTSGVTTVEVADLLAEITALPTTVDLADDVTVTDNSTITNCTGAAVIYTHQYSDVDNNPGVWIDYATTEDAVWNADVLGLAAGNYELRLRLECPDHGCTTVSDPVVITVNAVSLPCVDAECYEVRTADNPLTHRLFEGGDQGFNSATIDGGSQTFAVDGHASGATVTLTGSGQFRSSSPTLQNAGTTTARIRLRQRDTDLGNDMILTFDFSEPVCGVVSFSLSDWIGGPGTNPEIDVTSVGGTIEATPRSDFPANEVAIYQNVTPTSLEVRRPVGETNGYGLINFDNITSITFTARTGEFILGSYVFESCPIGDVMQVLYCPTANEFYSRDVNGDWQLDPSYTAIGEWSPIACT